MLLDLGVPQGLASGPLVLMVACSLDDHCKRVSVIGTFRVSVKQTAVFLLTWSFCCAALQRHKAADSCSVGVMEAPGLDKVAELSQKTAV